MTARRSGSGNRRRRPYKVFVQDIGPTWTFATRAAAEARAREAVEWMGYAEVLTWKAGEAGLWVWRPGAEPELLVNDLQRRVNEILGDRIDVDGRCPSCGGRLDDGGGPEAVICSVCGDEWPTDG